jgi:hypothetical protein
MTKYILLFKWEFYYDIETGFFYYTRFSFCYIVEICIYYTADITRLSLHIFHLESPYYCLLLTPPHSTFLFYESNYLFYHHIVPLHLKSRSSILTASKTLQRINYLSTARKIPSNNHFWTKLWYCFLFLYIVSRIIWKRSSFLSCTHKEAISN